MLDYVSKTEDMMIASTTKYGFQPPSKYAHTKSLLTVLSVLVQRWVKVGY